MEGSDEEEDDIEEDDGAEGHNRRDEYQRVNAETID